jgi:hypothetical protein
MTTAFAVSDVELTNKPMAVVDRRRAIGTLLGEPPSGATDPLGMRQARARRHGRRIEQTWESSADLVSATDANALAQAAHDAFYLHQPLVLTPDTVWLCIAQGFAQHVALNAEALRHRFVRHQGKKKLVVERPDFFLGQTNPWPEAFEAFSAQIGEHVGRLRDLVVGDFSTTGPVERAASEVVLMDAFQAYFEYEMMCGCGIPSITLDGTAEDWRSVRRRAAMLSEYGLESWTNALVPVLDEIVRSAEGHVDRSFWRSFFRYQSGSGPSELTGWILTLFPYLNGFEGDRVTIEPNPHLGRWEEALRKAESRQNAIRTPEGPGLLAIPSSLASAPVVFVDRRDGSRHPLRFVGGLFGVVQDRTTLALAPEFGWAIVHEPSPEPSP